MDFHQQDQCTLSWRTHKESDRLDFSKIIELLDEYKCSFVAVTQSFNTSNSMGRLMLNVLLSFAQYERELTSERIRDKFAASCKLGMWMGGVPPLGYDPKDRELVKNNKEAEIVKSIYQIFLETESVTETVRAINNLGHKTKSWTSEKGKKYHGTAFSKKATYHILQNPVYAGRIRHKDKIYQGKHESIIDADLWDKAQVLFTRKNDRVLKPVTRISTPPLLKGILHCGCCSAAMTPSYSMKKNGTRYRYYTCSSKHRLTNEKCSIRTISAAEIEDLVTTQIHKLLARPEIIAQVITASVIAKYDNEEDRLQDIQIITALKDASKVWDELFPAEQVRITHLLIKKVILNPEGVDIRIFNEGFNQFTEELTKNSEAA